MIAQHDAATLPAQFSLIQSKGTLDWAYAGFILASSAALMDRKVELFFTFYGLQCALKETAGLKVSPLGRPDMRVRSPVGPTWFRQVDWNRVLPGVVWTMPGMAKLATLGFKKQMAMQGQLPLDELRALCLELGVKMTACQMTVDLLGYEASDFVDGVVFAGAPTYFATSPQQQGLFI